MRTVQGNEAKALIETQLAAHNGGILSALSKYELSNAVRAWHATIRSIEEFINVPLFGIDDERLLMRLLSVPLDERFLRNPTAVWFQVRQALSPHFDPGTVQRFCQLMLQIAAISSAFRVNGQSSFGPGIVLDTIGGAIAYLQSRRRHFVSLLYTMPFACKGSVQLLETSMGPGRFPPSIFRLPCKLTRA